MSPPHARPHVMQTFWHGHGCSTLAPRKHKHTHTHAHTLMQTHTNAYSSLHLTLQIKTLFCRWPLDQRKFVLILVFFVVFLCVNKAGASTSNLELFFQPFSSRLCINADAMNNVYSVPPFQFPSEQQILPTTHFQKQPSTLQIDTKMPPVC